MPNAVTNNPSVSSQRRAGIYSVLVLALTTIHHAYGAIVYHTLWRLHVAVIAAPVALAIYAGLRAGAKAHQAGKGRGLTYWTAAVILLIPVGAIGLFEGGYNHLVKNVIYFGWGAHTMRQFFPAPMYEMPTDRIFESTGIAQLPLALAAAYWTVVMLVRARHASSSTPIPNQLRATR